MLVSTWRNGSGAFGVKIAFDDRMRYFSRHWTSVVLTLEGVQQPIMVNVGKPSFWTRTCGELISHDIKTWLIEKGLATWPHRRPHRLELRPISDNHFMLTIPR